MADKAIPRNLWAPVMELVVFLINISPYRVLNITLWEIRFGKQLMAKHLHIIRLTCWLIILQEIRNYKHVIKINPRA